MFILSSELYAFSVKDIFTQGKDSMNVGKANRNNKIGGTDLQGTSNILFNIFFGIGTGIAVIVGAILGIQFMQAGVDKKVQVKESLVAYVVSCIVLFGAYGIWKLIVVIMSSIS